MESMGPEQDKRVDRRTFVKRGLAAGGLAAGAGLGIARLADATSVRAFTANFSPLICTCTSGLSCKLRYHAGGSGAPPLDATIR